MVPSTVIIRQEDNQYSINENNLQQNRKKTTK